MDVTRLGDDPGEDGAVVLQVVDGEHGVVGVSLVIILEQKNCHKLKIVKL